MVESHNPSLDCSRVSLNRCNQDIPIELIEFYLIRCPYAKSDESAASAAQGQNLAEYNWENRALAKLMRWIQNNFLDEKNEVQLGFYVSDTVNETAEKLGIMDSEPCLSHPRAALQIKNKISISENGQCTVRLNETYATCFFRHIRNSIAHGSFYIDAKKHIALFDTSSKPNTPSDKKKYSAAIITNLSFLSDLKQFIEAGADAYDEPKEAPDYCKADSYRVNLRKDVILSSQESD